MSLRVCTSKGAVCVSVCVCVCVCVCLCDLSFSAMFVRSGVSSATTIAGGAVRVFHAVLDGPVTYLPQSPPPARPRRLALRLPLGVGSIGKFSLPHPLSCLFPRFA